MAIKKGLGRGLDILLPESDIPTGVTQIPISQLDVNPAQPRRDFNEDALRQLAESIRQTGVLQPLLVAPENGRYRIVAGERRYRAARMAGLHAVPCLARDMSEQERMEAALIENLQREDLNPMEEAAAIRELMTACGYTQETAAKRVGRSRPAVANLLRLLALPEEIQQLVKDNALSAGHARVLAGVESEARALELADLCVRQGLSVRELEKLAARPAQPAQKPQPKALPLELADMRERLQSALGVRAALTGSLSKGKIVLQYASRDELEAIYGALERLEGR